MYQKFTKKDLTLGMLVEIVDGTKYLIMDTQFGPSLVNEHGWQPLSLYKDDLNVADDCSVKRLTIQKVFGFPTKVVEGLQCTRSDRPVLFDRDLSAPKLCNVEVDDSGKVYTYEFTDAVKAGDIVKVPYGRSDRLVYAKVVTVYVGLANVGRYNQLTNEGIKIKTIKEVVR